MTERWVRRVKRCLASKRGAGPRYSDTMLLLRSIIDGLLGYFNKNTMAFVTWLLQGHEVVVTLSIAYSHSQTCMHYR